MDLGDIMAQLRIDEGTRLHVYKDSLGNLTVGIGHLVTPAEHLDERDAISEERCEALFVDDLTVALMECLDHIPKFVTLPAPIQEVCVNMMFNLGLRKFSRFTKMNAAIAERNWSKMAIEMEDSLWYRQVGERAERLIRRVLEVPNGT